MPVHVSLVYLSSFVTRESDHSQTAPGRATRRDVVSPGDTMDVLISYV